MTVWPSQAAVAAFSQVVAFGDSISDTGNVFAATGTPGAPYFGGRFSNGPLWVEVLAANLGVAAPTPSLLGGSNYAWGGAQTGTGLSFMGTPNLGTQVAGFVATSTLTPAQLVTITAAGNDFLNAGETNPLVPVNNVAAAITSLAGVGGRNFLLSNLPKLGQLPAVAGLPQAQRDALDALTLAYNGLLAGRVTQLRASLGVEIALFDADGLIDAARADPAAFGLTNTTGYALADGVLSGEGYLFWDNVHFTGSFHRQLGNAATRLVPEPSSWLMLATACAILIPSAVRRRRTAEG